MKIIIFLFGVLSQVLSASAQSNSEALSEPTSVSYDEYSASISNAEEMASFLRKHFGVAKAVYLTQIAQQLSQSFASTEQLQQQWQQSLATEIIEPTHFTQINTHALMAQTLIQYTNGMTLNRWRMHDLPLRTQLKAMNGPHISSETFKSWLNLSNHWHHIFANDGNNKLSQWLPWLTDGATLSSDISGDDLQTDQKQSLPSVLTHWTKSEDNDLSQLTDLADQIDYFDPFATALMRQQLHLQNEQTLALAYDWIEIYQLLELSGELLTADEQQKFALLVQNASDYWSKAEVEVNEINEKLYSLISELLINLPEKFKNPDHLNEPLNQQIFTLITGIKSPETYFSHPLRSDIQENLEVCLNLSSHQGSEPPVSIALNQFESCLAEFVEWGTVLAKSANLSGNLIKLENPNSINRSLDLPSPQIINNLTMQGAAEVSCQQQLNPKVNVVEWLFAAETLVWFNNRWPELMAEQLTSLQIDSMIAAGISLYSYPNCVNEADPLMNQFTLLKDKWERLKQEIVLQVNHYRNTELSPNSDVDFFKSIDQQTNYIPDNFVVTPCDATQSCGALLTLDSGAELLNLFPNHLKLAEQFGLGQLEICYDSVSWEQRKSKPTHLDNNKIANFEGQLSIQLNGLFRDESVFKKTLLSEQRHVYLFGENNQETLDAACPLPLVGKQINTSLDRGTFGLLPNRLTFLAAQKIDINAVMRNNWTQWQRQLNSDATEFNFFNEMNEVKTILNDAFLQRVNELQHQIYRKLITNNPSRTNDSALSKAAFEYVTHRKLLSHMTMGLYPQLYASQSRLQAAISGNNRLVDMSFFRNAYENQINVADMIVDGDSNFATHQQAWGSVNQAESLVHNTLDQLNQLKAKISQTSLAAEVQ